MEERRQREEVTLRLQKQEEKESATRNLNETYDSNPPAASNLNSTYTKNEVKLLKALLLYVIQ